MAVSQTLRNVRFEYREGAISASTTNYYEFNVLDANHWPIAVPSKCTMLVRWYVMFSKTSNRSYNTGFEVHASYEVDSGTLSSRGAVALGSIHKNAQITITGVASGVSSNEAQLQITTDANGAGFVSIVCEADIMVEN